MYPILNVVLFNIWQIHLFVIIVYNKFLLTCRYRYFIVNHLFHRFLTIFMFYAIENQIYNKSKSNIPINGIHRFKINSNLKNKVNLAK